MYSLCLSQVRWGTRQGGKFKAYPIITNKAIEEAYKKKAKYAEFMDGKTKMRVYFDKMLETVAHSRTTSTPVQRHLMEC